MRIFVAGATGAIGQPLVHTLIERGHTVVGMTRSAAKAAPLRAAGAQTVLADALDRAAVLKAVTEAEPDVVVNQLTALETVRKFRNLDKEFVATNRLRVEGTDNLMAAARASAVRMFVSQSYGSWAYRSGGSAPKTETDPLITPGPKVAKSFAALQHLERVTLDAPGMTGIVLRYASFYGPGTSLAVDGVFADEVRKRRLPIIGGGAGVWSFIHVEDAADATAAAIEAGVGGVFNIVDDDPTPARDWIPALADALGAKPPRHAPVWLARMLAGDMGVQWMTTMSGMSNAKARSTLAWQPAYPSYREGFRRGLGIPKAQLRSTS